MRHPMNPLATALYKVTHIPNYVRLPSAAARWGGGLVVRAQSLKLAAPRTARGAQQLEALIKAIDESLKHADVEDDGA